MSLKLKFFKLHTHFKLTIRTPEAEILETETPSLYLSNDLGDFMILPDHASFSSTIGYSPVFISHKEVIEEYSVRNGLLTFSNAQNQATILCFEAKKKEEVDYSSVKKYLKLIEEKLAQHEFSELNEYQYKFLLLFLLRRRKMFVFINLIYLS